MKYCDKCKIKVKQNIEQCPLCQNVLIQENNQTETLFPKVKNRKDLHLVWRVLILISVVTSFTCFLINVCFPSHGWWSLFLVLGIACAWIVTVYVIKKRRNIVRAIFYEVLVVSILSILWDFVTKWHGWSITYVIPILCMVSLISMFILMQALKLKEEDTLYYFLVSSILGIVPLILLLTKVVTTPYPSFVCVILSGISFFFILIFHGKTIHTEFQRRFHL